MPQIAMTIGAALTLTARIVSVFRMRAHGQSLSFYRPSRLRVSLMQRCSSSLTLIKDRCAFYRSMPAKFREDRQRVKRREIRGSVKSDLAAGLAAIFSVGTTSILGQIATYPNLTPWYASLEKPPFNPPNWVFAPVWTALYLLMAFAFWKILRLLPSSQRRKAIFLFMLMLVLNAAWSWMFFAAHSPALGLVNIVPQLALIFGLILVFYRLDRMAAWCLVPLAAWVTFAFLLNFSIWRLNA